MKISDEDILNGLVGIVVFCLLAYVAAEFFGGLFMFMH